MKINIIRFFTLKSNAWIFWALLLFFNHSVKAQNTIIVVNHLVDTQIKDQIFKFPILYINQSIKDFTFTELSYEHQRNKFARTQIADEINVYQFLAQGYYTTKNKFHLFGNLSIQKIEEKDLGWVLSDDRSEEQEVITPHYFFVARKGDWTSQLYKLNGGFSKQITRHISIAPKVLYYAAEYSRNIDPRPQIISKKIGGELQLGYQIAENHKTFLLVSYTQLDKDFSYLYKDDHLNFESYPETFLRFNAGYGRIVNYFKSNYNSRFSYKEIDNKIGLGYAFSNKNTIFTTLYYNQKSNNDFFTSVFTTKADERFKLEIKTNHIELFAFHKWDNNQLVSTFKYNQSDGINYDVNSKGYNYKNSLNAVSWQTSISKKTNTHINYLFGLDLFYQQNKYNDILATSNIKLNSLNTKIYGSKDFSFNKSKINTTINLNFYFTFPSSQLDYYDTSGGKNKVFFDEVIIHDYIVSTTSYLTPSYRLEYSYFIPKNKTAVFFINFRNKIALKKQSVDYTNIDTNNTNWLQLGIQLNY